MGTREKLQGNCQESGYTLSCNFDRSNLYALINLKAITIIMKGYFTTTTINLLQDML